MPSPRAVQRFQRPTTTGPRSGPPRRRPVRRLSIAGLLAMLAIALAPAAPAQATATGCSFYGKVAHLCITVHGKGLTIDDMSSSWVAVEQCTWRIDWRIYYNGATWWYSKGPDHLGCNHGTGSRFRGKGAAPHGSQMCAQLVNVATGKRYTSACVTIKR